MQVVFFRVFQEDKPFSADRNLDLNKGAFRMTSPFSSITRSG